MNGKLTILVCILVAGVIVGASLPIFDSLTASSDSIHNDGAGWVRFDLNRSADASYNINVSWDDDGYYIANGSNVQTFDDSTVTDFETIIYADSNVSVWTFDGDNILMLGTDAGAPVMASFTDPVSIARDSEGVVISDGTDSYTFGAPEWAYIPWTGGAYGFFIYDEERGVNNPANTPTAVIGGGNVGVYAYNDIYTYAGLGLTMHPIIDEETGLYYGAEWYKADEPLNPDDLNITPINPGIIIPGGDNTQGASGSSNPDPGVIDIYDPFNHSVPIMAVPTPSYTSGDWGYDIIQVDGVDKAVIVSYSGSGGTITIPATIGGYDVYRVGKDAVTNGSPQNNVFDNNSLSSGSTVIISDGIKEIGGRAFSGVSRLGGTLDIPDSVESVGYMAFYNSNYFTTINIGSGVNYIAPDSVGGVGVFTYMSGLTAINVSADNNTYSSHDGILLDKAQTTVIKCPQAINNVSIPNTVIEINTKAFDTCYNTGALVIPDSVTTIGTGAFYNSKFTGALVIPDSVTTMGTGVFYNSTSFTSLKLGTGLTTIPYNTFTNCRIPGVLTIPSNITTIDGGAFKGNYFDTVVIPNTVTSIGGGSFPNNTFSSNSYLKNVVYASEAIPKTADFSSCNNCEEILDLSDAVDFNANKYGLPAGAFVYDSIGDCFGYIAVADMGGGDDNGTIGDLIAILPVIMLAGIALFAIVALVVTRN